MFWIRSGVAERLHEVEKHVLRPHPRPRPRCRGRNGGRGGTPGDGGGGTAPRRQAPCAEAAPLDAGGPRDTTWGRCARAGRTARHRGDGGATPRPRPRAEPGSLQRLTESLGARDPSAAMHYEPTTSAVISHLHNRDRRRFPLRARGDDRGSEPGDARSALFPPRSAPRLQQLTPTHGSTRHRPIAAAAARSRPALQASSLPSRRPRPDQPLVSDLPPRSGRSGLALLCGGRRRGQPIWPSPSSASCRRDRDLAEPSSGLPPRCLVLAESSSRTRPRVLDLPGDTRHDANPRSGTLERCFKILPSPRSRPLTPRR